MSVSQNDGDPKQSIGCGKKRCQLNNTTIYSFLGAGGGGFEILRDTDTRTCQQVVLYNLDLPSNQDASDK